MRVVSFCRAAALLAGTLLFAAAAAAQPADTILLHGKIVTEDKTASVRSAIAIADGRILAVGSDADIRKLKGAKTRIVDLDGRTVIPGLIDSHVHGIRAALSFATEVSWIDAGSLAEALGRIRDAAKTAKPGAWLIVAGGWTDEQFAEKRRPTQAELVAVAPDNPVYVQLFYQWAMLTPSALRALNITGDGDLPQGAKLERDASGNPTGAITGTIREFGAIFAKLPQPSEAEQIAGTKKFFREMNRLGVTGIVDPGGIGMTPQSYTALFQVWRERALTLRVAYTLSALAPGTDEMKTFQDLTQLLPAGFGDDMLRFTGIGEIVTWGMYNNDNPTEPQKQQFYEIAKWAAERGMQLRVHWPHDASVGQLLDIFERVDRDVKVAPLHWIVDHLDDALGDEPRAHQGVGCRLGISGRNVFRGRSLRQGRGPRCRSARAAARNRFAHGGDHGRRHRRAPGHELQPFRGTALDARWQDRRRHAAPRRRRDAEPHGSAALLYARTAPGSPRTKGAAAGSNPASSPILPCSIAITLRCRSRRSVACNRC